MGVLCNTSNERKLKYNIFCIIELKSGKIVTSSDDSTIKIWDIDSHNCLCSIKDQGLILCLLEFNQDKILAGNNVNNIQLWDINDSNHSENIYTFKGHSSSVNCLVKCNDELFASASKDNYIRIWNYVNRKCIKKLEGHNNSIYSLALLLEKRLCSGSADCTIKIWSLEKFSCEQTLNEHNKPVKCICQLSNGYLVSGSEDNNIIIWYENEHNYIKLIELKGHNSTVNSICQISDKIFASSSSDNTIKIWDTITMECINTLEGILLNKNDIIPVIYHSSGRLISPLKDDFKSLEYNIESVDTIKTVNIKEKINLTFKSTSGCQTDIFTDYDKSLNEVIGEYLEKVGHSEPFDTNSITFLLNGKKLNINSEEKIKDFIKNNNVPIITVLDTNGCLKTQ